MDPEIQNFIKVWISALASLTYCYFVSLKIPKGKFRLLSFLPVFYILTTLPLNLTGITFLGSTGFFLTWLANFKLLLFSFGQGPLSNPSISLSRFISLASLPIRITNTSEPFSESTKKSSSTLKKSLSNKIRDTSFLNNTKSTSPNLKNSVTKQNGEPPLPKISTKAPKSLLNLATKGLVLVLLIVVYDHIQSHRNLMLVYYCCYMYIILEVMITLTATIAGVLIGVELEPLFNEPYLSTSLQDFWGRRWNLAVTNILRPTVYEPTKLVSVKAFGTKSGTLIAVFATFVVSGLIHELIFYFIGRATPTWEVTCFFVLQGICLVVEIAVKRALRGRWQLHGLVSMPLTVGFVMMTGFWLFFPPLIQCNAEVRAREEVVAVVNFVKSVMGL